MARLNQAKYALLGMLTHESMSGYDIKKKITHSISYFWDASYGQIYPELRSLEKAGLVSKTVKAGDSRPDRKIYSITAMGVNELVSWLSSPAAKEQIRFEILLKLFFGNLVPVSVSRGNIRAFHSRSCQNLTAMEETEARLKEGEGGGEAFFYPLLTIMLGKRVYRATMEWADEAIALLDAIEAGEGKGTGSPAAAVSTGPGAVPEGRKKGRTSFSYNEDEKTRRLS